jgi:hypothetical protein
VGVCAGVGVLAVAGTLATGIGAGVDTGAGTGAGGVETVAVTETLAGASGVGAGVATGVGTGVGAIEGLAATGTLAGTTGVWAGAGVGVITGVGALTVTAGLIFGRATGVTTAALGDFTGRFCGAGVFWPAGVFFAGTPRRRRALALGCGFGAARFAEVLFTGVRPLAAFVFFGAAFWRAGALGDFLAMVGCG